MHITILYEDNHIIAVDKPAGMLTQPVEGRLGMEDHVKEYIRLTYKKPGAAFAHAVHRLDKDVRGIVIFAKTDKALSRLMETLRTHQCVKIYEALVDRPLPLGEYEDYLIHDDHRARIVPQTHDRAQLSRLTVLSCVPYAAVWVVRLQLHTGRYHQIRVQLAHRGAPIIGDTRYGSTKKYHAGIALQHVMFSCIHPTLKTECSFTVQACWNTELSQTL